MRRAEQCPAWASEGRIWPDWVLATHRIELGLRFHATSMLGLTTLNVLLVPLNTAPASLLRARNVYFKPVVTFLQSSSALKPPAANGHFIPVGLGNNLGLSLASACRRELRNTRGVPGAFRPR